MYTNQNSSKVSVTLSLVSHKNTQEIKHLISTLTKDRSGIKFQIIITDNLNDNLIENQFPNCHILRNKHPQGFAHNHNTAFHHAKGRYFCILNPDIVFVENVFEKLIALIEKGEADIVAPVVVDQNGLVQDSFRDMPTPSELVRRRLRRQESEISLSLDSDTISPDWIAGMFLLMKAETFRQLGGFDEKFFLYFEDVDFCTRTRLQRFSLLVDTRTRVQHDAHRSSRKNVKYLFWHLQSAYRFFTSSIYYQAKKNRSRQ